MRSRRKKAPSVPASLQRSASASNRRFSLPENWRRLAIATTSGSRRAASSEAVSPVALRASSATASEEEPNDPFIEDFSNELMCMSYLYSKLPETGVSPHIGTGGPDLGQVFARAIPGDWGPHLATMRNFWSSVMLTTGRYKGNPVAVHHRVDGIELDLFDRWLTLFEQTCGELFDDSLANVFHAKAARDCPHERRPGDTGDPCTKEAL